MAHIIYNVSFDCNMSGSTFEYRGGGPFSTILSVVNYYLAKGFSICHLTISPAK